MKKKHYRIREGSPLYYMKKALLYIAVIAFLFALGVLNSWDLGLL